MYIVKIEDSIGSITKPGYEKFSDAEDVCRRFGSRIADREDLELVYVRVLDEDGTVLFDLKTDTYLCDRTAYEKKPAERAA